MPLETWKAEGRAMGANHKSCACVHVRVHVCVHVCVRVCVRVQPWTHKTHYAWPVANEMSMA